MGNQLTNLTFEEWLLYVFDHPVDETKGEWYWDLNRDWWKEEPAEAEADFKKYEELTGQKP